MLMFELDHGSRPTAGIVCGVLPVLTGGLVRPDADVVGLLLQSDPVPHAETPGHLARELNPARPVQRRVVACVQRGLGGPT